MRAAGKLPVRSRHATTASCLCAPAAPQAQCRLLCCPCPQRRSQRCGIWAPPIPSSRQGGQHTLALGPASTARPSLSPGRAQAPAEPGLWCCRSSAGAASLCLQLPGLGSLGSPGRRWGEKGSLQAQKH